MVHIITDTTACLPEAIAKQYDIPVIPQIINFGEESFYEERDIDNPTFMSRLRTSSELPKTAAPPPELFVEEFRRLSATNKTILCIHPSAEVSGTVRSATVAAQDFPDLDIRVIDTRVIASPLGTMVEFAARWAAEGRQDQHPGQPRGARAVRHHRHPHLPRHQGRGGRQADRRQPAL